MATVTSPIITDSTGQAIVAAIQAIPGGGGGGASSASIAPIESTTTASKAYAVGDLLFYNNILYRVITAISSGGTIEISGATPNVIATDVDTELKGKIKLSSTPGLVKNDGTIDTTTYISDVSDKADKVTSATNGNLAKLDSNGNLADSGVASTDVVTTSSTAGLIKNDGSIDTNTYPSATITSPANKQILEYNSTLSKWENKNKFISLTGTLAANSDTLTFTNAAITSTARFETYTQDTYLPLLDISRDGTTLTLKFPEQDSAVNVKVLIYED